MQKTIALDPGRWQFYLSLGVLQARNNQPDSAEASFQKVIELNPTASQAQLLLGNYYQSRVRLGDAERSFRDAIAVDQKNAESRAALARLYLAEAGRQKRRMLPAAPSKICLKIPQGTAC
jgi:Flp pilus assembly protein TadD